MRGWAETGAGRVVRVVPDGDMGVVSWRMQACFAAEFAFCINFETRNVKIVFAFLHRNML